MVDNKFYKQVSAIITGSTISSELTLVVDDTAAPNPPTGLFVSTIHRLSLPSYSDGDGAVLHVDDRGRLLVSVGQADLSSSVGTEDSAAPANPVGTFPMAIYRVTSPTYSDGDAAILHTTSTGSLKVTSTPILPASSTITSVSGTVSSTTLLASDSTRLGASLFNEQPTDGSGETLYLILAAEPVTTTNYTVQLAPNTYYEVPFGYTGDIRGIWSTALGTARITELS